VLSGVRSEIHLQLDDSIYYYQLSKNVPTMAYKGLFFGFHVSAFQASIILFFGQAEGLATQGLVAPTGAPAPWAIHISAFQAFVSPYQS